VKKIIVIGSGGAGKSTLSQKLGKILKLQVHYLDAYFWLPGWIERDKTEFISIVKRLINENEWILDGNFKNTMKMRMQACDTIIFLDYNRLTCFKGAAFRLFRDRGKSRTSMTDGCNEKFDWEYYKWIWNYPKIKNRVYDLIEKYRNSRNVFVFKNRKDTDRFLSELINHEAGAS